MEENVCYREYKISQARNARRRKKPENGSKTT
jgi:hypothetical protein